MNRPESQEEFDEMCEVAIDWISSNKDEEACEVLHAIIPASVNDTPYKRTYAELSASLARCYFKMDNWGNAALYFTAYFEACDIHNIEDHPQFYLLYAYSLYNVGLNELALNQFRRALEFSKGQNDINKVNLILGYIDSCKGRIN
jgi:tetratricopeptide (TPR) repeat protein